MRIDGNTKVYGIIGNPVSHSFSPAMHNAAFEETGFNGVYVPLPVTNPSRLGHALDQLSIAGASVTIPWKLHALRMAKKNDPVARLSGAANTLYRDSSGALWATNTDGYGAVLSLKKEGIDLTGKKVAILGAGGSARAIVAALLPELPAEIIVAARREDAARSLLQKFSGMVKFSLLRYAGFSHGFVDSDIIIHTTPAGMKGGPAPDEIVIPVNTLRPGQVIFDIVYNPHETPLIRAALARSLHVVYGNRMLLYQGVAQFEIFTGLTAPVQAMESALVRQLKERHGP